MPTEHEHAENLNASGEKDGRSAYEAAPTGTSKKETAQQSNLWLLAFAAAITCDLLDLIPEAGWIIALFIRPFLYIFLWKQKSKKNKSKAWSYILLTVAFIPIIDLIPLDTVSVFMAYLQREK